MKPFLTLILFLFCLSGFAQLTNRQVLDLKSGRAIDDTSHIYWLPYAPGKKFLLIQASNSRMSHKNELSLDFKMKKGSQICAARGGVIMDARSDSDKGGLKQENLNDGNFIIIQHNDRSVAKYWHLEKDGVLVKVGPLTQSSPDLVIVPCSAYR